MNILNTEHIFNFSILLALSIPSCTIQEAKHLKNVISPFKGYI